MESALTVRFRFLDCGHQIGVLLRAGKWKRAFRVRNPFRRSLTDEQFYRGDGRWRWPVSLWVRS